MSDFDPVNLDDSIEVLDFESEFQNQLNIYESKLYDSAENIKVGRENLVKWVEEILEEKNKNISTLTIKVQNARLLQNRSKVGSQSEQVKRLEKEVAQTKEKLSSAEKESVSLRSQLQLSIEYPYRSQKQSEEVKRAKVEAGKLNDQLKRRDDIIKVLRNDLSKEKTKHTNQSQEATRAIAEAVVMKDQLKCQQDTIKWLEQEVMQTKEKLSSAEKESVSLRSQLRRLSIGNRWFEQSQELETAKAKIVKLKKQLNDQLKSQQDTIKDLQNDLSKEKTEHANYKRNSWSLDQVKCLEEENTQMKEKISSMENENLSLRSQMLSNNLVSQKQFEEMSRAKANVVSLNDKVKFQKDIIKDLNSNLNIEKTKHANYVANSKLLDPMSENEQDRIKSIETELIRQNNLLNEIELELNQVDLFGNYISSKINAIIVMRQYVSSTMEETLKQAVLKMEESKALTQKSLQRLKDNKKYNENTPPENSMLSFQSKQDVKPNAPDKSTSSTNVDSMVLAPHSVVITELNHTENSKGIIPNSISQISIEIPSRIAQPAVTQRIEKKKWGTQRRPPRCNKKDEFASIRDEKRFETCSKFKMPTCIQCGEGGPIVFLSPTGHQNSWSPISVEGPVRNYGYKAFFTFTRCHNTSCNANPLDRYPVIINQITIDIRNHIQRYYAGWLVCEDPGCSTRTRRLPLQFQGAGACPICKKCGKATMHLEYTESQLDLQLLYYQNLFDYQTVLDRTSGEEKEALNRSLQKLTRPRSPHYISNATIESRSIYDYLKCATDRMIRDNRYSKFR